MNQATTAQPVEYCEGVVKKFTIATIFWGVIGVHLPAFGSQQCGDPPVAISAILAGQADDRSCQCLFILPAAGHLPLGRTMLTHHGTGSSLRDTQFGLKMINALPAAGGA